MIGLALVLRDLVQRRLGVGVAAGAIVVGAALSALLAPPSLVIASAAAFLLSEIGRSRGLHAACAAPAGPRRARVEHGRARGRLYRLPLAGIRLAGVPAGQIVGKAWMVLLSIPFVAWLRRRDHRLGSCAGLSIIPGGSCHECGRL